MSSFVSISVPIPAGAVAFIRREAVPGAPEAGSGKAARRRHRRAPRQYRQGGWAAALVVAGAALAALSFNLLLRPAGIPSGGVVGVSLVLERLLHWSPAVVQWALNLGILAACGLTLGRGFVVKSIAGSLLVPLVVYLTQGWAAMTTNPLLAAICGGAGLGAGVGLVYRANASVGGLSSLALWLNRKEGWPVSRVMIALDGVVVAITAAWLGAEAALYAGLCVFVTGRVARAVMTGFNNAKVATIISTRTEEIRAAVLNDIPLGVTTLRGKGGYSGREQEVLMVVMTPAELARLKPVVHACDPQAFMIVSDASEVLGHGFAPHA